MKNRSTLSKFFFGERIVVDRARLNYKELLCYEWNKIARLITNICLLLIYNSLFAAGWYAISKSQGSYNIPILDGVANSTIYVGYGLGNGAINLTHWIVNKFSKEKTRKDMADNGNPIPRKSGIGITFLVLSFLPFIIWLIGRIVISIKCRVYVKKNGSLETKDQKRYYDLQTAKVQKDTVLEAMTAAVKGLQK